jgi:hypothetical protein
MTKQKLDIMKLLKDTGRTMYVNEEVAKSAPTYTGKLEFFKLNKYMTCQELQDEYDKRGLKPASIVSLCEYDKTNRDDLDKMQYVCSQWKNTDGKWCYVSVDQWDDGRRVLVDRRGSEWDDDFWGCGVRKSELGTGDSEVLEPQSLDLEKRVEAIENWINNVKSQLL